MPDFNLDYCDVIPMILSWRDDFRPAKPFFHGAKMMGRVCEKRGFGLVLKRISRVCYRMHIASDQFDLASIWCLRGNKDGTLSIQLLSVFKQDSEWRTIVVDEIDNPHRYDCPIEWLPLATSGISSKWRRALISATIERAREQLFNCGDLIDSLDVVGAN